MDNNRVDGDKSRRLNCKIQSSQKPIQQKTDTLFVVPNGPSCRLRSR